MRVQVRWENGALYPVRPLRLKHTTVTVDIPEEEIETKNRNLDDAVEAMLHKFELIRSQPVYSGDERPLAPRQLERMEAFELRSQIREEQGRPS